MKAWLLILFIAIAVFLRVILLGQIPPGPNWDEASAGYNALTIAKTGKDEWETKFPLTFPAFGDFKNALYIYATALPVKFFGLNLFTNRIVSSLIGSALIVIWYLIANYFLKNRAISLMTALFITFSPYGIFFSRIGDDGFIMASFLTGLGLLFEAIFIKNRRPSFFLFSILSLIAAVFAYDFARIVSPALLLVIFFINFFLLKTKKVYFILPVLFSIAASFLILNQSNIGAFRSLKYAGVFGEEKGVVIEINEFRQHDQNSLLSKILHNKATFFGIDLVKNYVSHFGADYLVNFRFQNSVAESFWPPLYTVMLPFYYFGLFLLFANLSKKELRPKIIVLLTLIFISPLPSAITENAPDSHRYLGSFGTHEFLSAFGLYQACKLFLPAKNKILVRSLISSFFIIYFLGVFLFLKFFFFTYPKKYGKIYASGEKLVSKTVKENYKKYDYFIYSEQLTLFPYIYPLYAFQFDPEKYWALRKYSLHEDGWYGVDGFDKFLFPKRFDTKILKDSVFSDKKVMLFLTTSEFEDLEKAKEFKKGSVSIFDGLQTHSGVEKIYLVTFVL